MGVSARKYQENCIMDNLMKNFTAHKYPGEIMHIVWIQNILVKIISGLVLVLTFLLVKNYTMIYKLDAAAKKT